MAVSPLNASNYYLDTYYLDYGNIYRVMGSFTQVTGKDLQPRVSYLCRNRSQQPWLRQLLPYLLLPWNSPMNPGFPFRPIASNR